MPSLIKRYNAVAEYSALMSTNPSAQLRGRHLRRDDSDSTASPTSCAALSDEAQEWYEAMCPPLEDWQEVIQRFQDHPEFSQERIFIFFAPFVVFSVLFVVAIIAVQPHSFVHRILEQPSNHIGDMVEIFALMSGGLFSGLLTLKCFLWGVAELASVVLAMETKKERRIREGDGIPTSSDTMVLSGFLM
ncbi:hypothetical protein BV20DRAFT_981942 [Pilatotrama ljubarskyi]|nr:hypothetical protein BV20DRAFT_981942 [Pilatotrama ljubarskyi]